MAAGAVSASQRFSCAGHDQPSKLRARRPCRSVRRGAEEAVGAKRASGRRRVLYLDRTQLELALLLAAPANDVFLVGDDDRTIYGWRLADVNLQVHRRAPVGPDRLAA
jgi:hypothetical protein